MNGFDMYCDVFDKLNPFTGPSLYFHYRTLSLRRQYGTIAELLTDECFLESLYATLTAWGLHRMGPKGAKLVDFKVMVDGLRALEKPINNLAPLTIWNLESEHVADVGRRIWEVLSTLTVGVGESKIVAGSKSLHHILPDLVPPIDRAHTLHFFFGHTTLNQGDETAFAEMFPYFHQIATQSRSKIETRLGHGMNTSPTKVVDNAIVGYVRAVLKGGNE